MSFGEIDLRVVVVVLVLAVVVGVLWLSWKIVRGTVMFVPDWLAERAYQKNKETKPGEVEGTDGGWLDVTTPESDSFTYMVRQKEKGWDFFAFYVKFTTEFMYVSKALRTSMWAHKRIEAAKAIMADDAWLKDARKFDMQEISSSSFRVIQRQLVQHTGYVVVMDYGDASLNSISSMG